MLLLEQEWKRSTSSDAKIPKQNQEREKKNKAHKNLHGSTTGLRPQAKTQ